MTCGTGSNPPKCTGSAMGGAPYCTCGEEARFQMETRFWSIVDRDGLTGLPSDMWAALETLVNRAS